MYKMNIAAVYATNNPPSHTRMLSWCPYEITERNSPTAPFQVAVFMPLCSRPAAWIPLMSVPHIPSCPTTSYNGDWRTKNSSAAFAGVTRLSATSVSDALKGSTLTESVQSRSSDHEQVTFDLIHGFPVLIRQVIRPHKHPKTSNTDEDTLA